MVVALAAGLLVVSHNSSEGTDLRPGRYDDLASLVDSESRRVQDQQAQVEALTREVDALTGSFQDGAVREAKAKAASVGAVAGMEPVKGQGVTIVLADAPKDEANASSIDPNSFVVHQQDIQAVVNALWAGGAKAVTVQGQRVITTTVIKCEGSMVTLDGLPFPQPYVISGVGDDLVGILAAVERDPLLIRYRQDADNPAIGVGWDLSTQEQMTAPGYTGVVNLAFAKPADN
jgi:uncharacterized protein YlxW (UPF0749 family)